MEANGGYNFLWKKKAYFATSKGVDTFVKLLGDRPHVVQDKKRFSVVRWA